MTPAFFVFPPVFSLFGANVRADLNQLLEATGVRLRPHVEGIIAARYAARQPLEAVDACRPLKRVVETFAHVPCDPQPDG
jgi:hypothetical protein